MCSLREIINEGVWRLPGPTRRTSWGPPLTLIMRKRRVCSWQLMEALCEAECPSKNTWFLTAGSYPPWDLTQPNTASLPSWCKISAAEKDTQQGRGSVNQPGDVTEVSTEPQSSEMRLNLREKFKGHLPSSLAIFFPVTWFPLPEKGTE